MPDYRDRPPLSYYRTPLPGVDYSELQGKLIVIEGPDAVGRTTQIRGLKPWLEELGHAVLDTGMARSALAGKGIKEAKQGNTLGPVTMTMYYLTDFADRLENEMIPALRAGFIVLTDRYIFSQMARALLRGADREWIKKVFEFTLKPDLVIYLRVGIEDLITRVIQHSGFNYWESGMDLHLGEDMYESFVEYQTRMLREFDTMAGEYNFQVIETSPNIEEVFEQIKSRVEPLMETRKSRTNPILPASNPSPN